MTSYQPISCEFHDALESYATRRAPVDIVLLDPAGAEQRIRTVVSDIFARNGEEFLVTQDGLHIRLDQLKSIANFQ
jgi:Rho-binding antiterminator